MRSGGSRNLRPHSTFGRFTELLARFTIAIDTASASLTRDVPADSSDLLALASLEGKRFPQVCNPVAAGELNCRRCSRNPLPMISSIALLSWKVEITVIFHLISPRSVVEEPSRKRQREWTQDKFCYFLLKLIIIQATQPVIFLNVGPRDVDGVFQSYRSLFVPPTNLS